MLLVFDPFLSTNLIYYIPTFINVNTFNQRVNKFFTINIIMVKYTLTNEAY